MKSSVQALRMPRGGTLIEGGLAADLLGNPWLLFAMVCGSAISAGLILATAYGNGIGLDFSILWKAAQARQPYAPDAYAPFVYPPTAWIWIAPLKLLAFWPAFILWSALSVAVFLAVTRRPILFLSPIVVQGLVFGQPTLLLASMALARSRHRGLLVGVALTLKPQILFLAPLVFLVRRDWSVLISIAVGATASLLVSVVAFGFQPWLDWLQALDHLRHVMAARNLWWMTITPYGTAARFGLDPWPFWAVGAALGLIVAVRSRSDPLFVSVLASALATPYAYAQDLVLLLPLCLVWIERDRKPLASLIFAGALIPAALVGVAIGELRMGRLRDIGKAAKALADRLIIKPAPPGICTHCRKQPVCDAGRRAGISMCEDCLLIVGW